MTTTPSTLKRDTEHHYKGDRGKFYHQTKRAIPEEAFFWVSRLRAKKFQQYINGGDTVLEYGVGYGWNLSRIICHRRIGFDISEFLKETVISQEIDFITDLKGLSEGIADVIICHHVLEHVCNPADSLEEMYRLLRPGGRLLIFVPYYLSSSFSSSDRDHHLYSWDVQTLGNLITECRFIFESGKIGYFGYDRFSAQLAARFQLGEWGYRIVRDLLHFAKPRKEVRIIAIKP